jgi:hypothetical protein
VCPRWKEPLDAPRWVEPVDECPPEPLAMVERVAALIEPDLRLTLDPAIECSAFEDGRGKAQAFFLRAIWPPTIQQDIHVLPDWNEAITVVRALERLQDSDFFDYYVDPWPRCSFHPDSTHSMEARASGETA